MKFLFLIYCANIYIKTKDIIFGVIDKMKIIITKRNQIFSIIILMTMIIPSISSIETVDNTIKENVSLDSAVIVAESKLSELGKSDSFCIDEIIKINSDDKSILCYMIELNPNGYVIVSGKYNLPPVIAYSLSCINDDTLNERDLFIDLLKTDITSRLENMQEISNLYIQENQNNWDNYLGCSNIEKLNLDYQQWPPEGTTTTEGWVETRWSQNSPYNNFCPIDPDSGKRGVAGCPAIAMAQILNYHKTTNGVLFNDSDDYYHNYGNRFWIDNDHEKYDFPSFPELNIYLETLNDHYNENVDITNDDKAALVFACGTAAKQVYSPEGSGTFGVDQAFDAYQKFNCDTIELINSEDVDLYERVSQNIKEAYPVHLAVVTPSWNAGHNLVIDGYNTDDYYHLNFGWGGAYDGWYKLPEELPYDLTVFEGIIVDIMKIEAGPDLSCNGSIAFSNIKLGQLVEGSFIIENIGDPGSLLDWEIESYPDWGSWEFSMDEGFDLTPEDGPITINVQITAPENKGKTYTGGIKIINKNTPGDIDLIPVSITNSKTNVYLNQWILRFIENHSNLAKIINNILY